MQQPDLEDLRQFVQRYDFPTDLLVEVTSYCNLDCIMCPQSRLTRPKGRMDFELWKTLMDEVAAVAPKTKIWPTLMGEPMLHPQIWDMLKYAKDAGIEHITLNSNLTVFQQKDVDKLFDSRLDNLCVGYDGITPETYGIIRPRKRAKDEGAYTDGGNLKVVHDNVLFILAERAKRGLTHPQITIQLVILDENEHEEQAFIDYWTKSGHDVKLKIKPGTGWSDGAKPWSGIINVTRDEIDIPCTWLIRQMTVFWNGHVPQCDGDWDGHTFKGDATKHSLYDIWHGDLEVVRERHLSQDFDFAPCNTCNDWQAGRSTNIQCGSHGEPAGFTA